MTRLTFKRSCDRSDLHICFLSAKERCRILGVALEPCASLDVKLIRGKKKKSAGSVGGDVHNLPIDVARVGPGLFKISRLLHRME